MDRVTTEYFGYTPDPIKTITHLVRNPQIWTLCGIHVERSLDWDELISTDYDETDCPECATIVKKEMREYLQDAGSL